MEKNFPNCSLVSSVKGEKKRTFLVTADLHERSLGGERDKDKKSDVYEDVALPCDVLDSERVTNDHLI